MALTVSVAIATYNRARMVREAVEAALRQSLEPLEVVVSDDASTDETPSVLRELAQRDARVIVLRQQINSGGVANWNCAMRETHGDLIAWCSDDDQYCEEHLSASARYLTDHPEVGLVHSGFVDLIETAACVERQRRPWRSSAPLKVDRNNLFAYLTRYYDWPFHPSTIVTRREVWEHVGEFDPAFALADTEWFVRVAEAFPVVWLPRTGVLNRRHGANWSNRVGSARMQREIFQIVEKAIERRWPKITLPRLFWKVVWRANVRLRLLLTLWARIESGHQDAALAAWETLARFTGRTMPRMLARLGSAGIRRLARRGKSAVDARQSVSPL